MQIWGRRKSGSDSELKFYGNIVSVYEQGKCESIRMWSIYHMKRTFNFFLIEKNHSYDKQMSWRCAYQVVNKIYYFFFEVLVS